MMIMMTFNDTFTLLLPPQLLSNPRFTGDETFLNNEDVRI